MICVRVCTRALKLSCVHVRDIDVNRMLCDKTQSPQKHSPRNVRNALIWYLLPQLVTKQRSLPFLARLSPDVKIHCHALAVAKKHEGSYETVVLSNKDNGGTEHLKLAHVSGKKWVVHPGTTMSTSLMFITAIADEPGSSSQSKRPKTSSKFTKVDKIKPIKNEESLSKLFAVAHHIAEVERAKIEKRDIDIKVAHAFFDKSSPETIPKQVFVLWSAASSGAEEHVNVAPFSTLCPRRI